MTPLPTPCPLSSFPFFADCTYYVTFFSMCTFFLFFLSHNPISHFFFPMNITAIDLSSFHIMFVILCILCFLSDGWMEGIVKLWDSRDSFSGDPYFFFLLFLFTFILKHAIHTCNTHFQRSYSKRNKNMRSFDLPGYLLMLLSKSHKVPFS